MCLLPEQDPRGLVTCCGHMAAGGGAGACTYICLSPVCFSSRRDGSFSPQPPPLSGGSRAPSHPSCPLIISSYQLQAPRVIFSSPPLRGQTPSPLVSAVETPLTRLPGLCLLCSPPYGQRAYPLPTTSLSRAEARLAHLVSRIIKKVSPSRAATVPALPAVAACSLGLALRVSSLDFKVGLGHLGAGGIHISPRFTLNPEKLNEHLRIGCSLRRARLGTAKRLGTGFLFVCFSKSSFFSKYVE